MVKRAQDDPQQHLTDAKYDRYLLFKRICERYFIRRHLPRLHTHTHTQTHMSEVPVKFLIQLCRDAKQKSCGPNC